MSWKFTKKAIIWALVVEKGENRLRYRPTGISWGYGIMKNEKSTFLLRTCTYEAILEFLKYSRLTLLKFQNLTKPRSSCLNFLDGDGFSCINGNITLARIPT